MEQLNKFFTVFAILCFCTAMAYSQDCNSYLKKATEFVSQKKYCDAKRYYQAYGNCNADADISTEIAMCERFCKIRVGDGDEVENIDPILDPNPRGTTTTNKFQSNQAFFEELEPTQQMQNRSANLSVINGKVYLEGKHIKYDQVSSILTSNDLLTNVGATDIYTSGYSRQSWGNSIGWASTIVNLAGAGFLFAAIAQNKKVADENATDYFLKGIKSDAQQKEELYSGLGYSFIGVGMLALIPSFALKKSGNRRIKKAVDIYNNSIQPKRLTDVSLKFGGTQSGGIGLTLNF